VHGRSLCGKKSHSRQRLCGLENLFGPRAYKIILCHHSPSNCAVRIDQELSRTRNVCVFSAGDGWQRGVIGGVNQIIAANCLEFWILVASCMIALPAEVTRIVTCVDIPQ
jgi:hypothetical protein